MVTNILKNILDSDAFEQLIARAVVANEWFCEADIRYAINAIKTDFLGVEPIVTPINKKIGIVCAGNIPLVGFGDMYHALLSGCEVWLKPSRRDILMNGFANLVTIVDDIDKLNAVDEIWAMGSNQLCNILQTKFDSKPLLLRGTRTSIAIVDGSETMAEISGLGDDIFLYCGMGCRSVSHIYVPREYDMAKLKFSGRDMPPSWSDAYRYAKAMATMRGENFIDGGFYILKNQASTAVGTIGYSFYDTTSEIDIADKKCIIGHSHTPFGRGQRPLGHTDYTDLLIDTERIRVNQ